AGGGGNDTITLSGILSLPGVTLVIQSEHISVNGATVNTTGGATAGSVSLQAAHDTTGSATLGFVSATGGSSVTLNGANVQSGSVSATATTTVTPPSPTGIGSVAIALDGSSSATVAVIASSINSTGDTTLRAESVFAANMTATGFAAQADTSVDAAVVGSIVNSSATTSVTGASSLNAAALKIEARNTAGVNSLGDASPATSGAGIAITNLTMATLAFIEGGTTVNATTLSLSADADGSASASSNASPGGATANNASPSSRTANNASTSDGTLTFAGALSFSRLVSTTDAYVAGTGGDRPNITTTGAQKVHAGSRVKSKADADGSTVAVGSTGIGIAISVNLATITTSARL